jgi:iron complex outermembrane receptor protein
MVAYGVAVALGSMTIPTHAADSASVATTEPKLEEIIVTAQKRTEKLQDVPATINVLSAAELQSQGLNQLSDYAKEFPGLNLVGAGGAGTLFPVIRGIFDGAEGSSLVGIYLDDTPFTPTAAGTFDGTAFAFDPDLGDIDHIEVLAGPQSTLYGASSMGGLIKYVTKQPDVNNFEGSVRVDGSQVDGGGAGYGVHASANLPLVTDKIAVRVSVFDREDPGFVDNVHYGNRNVNQEHVDGGRVSVLFKISDDLETTVNALGQRIDSASTGQVFLSPQTLRPLLGSLAYSSPIQPERIINSANLSDTTRWDMHFATLTNIASYAYIRVKAPSDNSIYGGFIGAPLQDYFDTVSDNASNRLSDEIRWASAPGKLEWLLAGFYTVERDHAAENTQTVNASGQPLPPADPFFDIYDYRFDVKFTEKAVFGNLTYHLTDRLEGTVGMRYSENTQPVHTVTEGDFGITNTRTNSRDSSDTYLATISYKPESNTTLYIRAASGYRPGGSFVPPPGVDIPGTYGPDHLWNYEAGIKGSLMDQRIAYSADVFHMVWTDLQLQFISPKGLQYPGNVGSAKSDGAEGSLRFMPVEGLTASLNAAYTKAKITADVASVNAVSGEPLPYSPKFTGAAIVDYRFPTSHGITPTAGVTYAYHGSSNTNFAGAQVAATSVYELASYATLSLRAGIDWSNYSVVFRVDNVTNKYGLSYAAASLAQQSPLIGYVIQPRTVGLSIKARY